MIATWRDHTAKRHGAMSRLPSMTRADWACDANVTARYSRHEVRHAASDRRRPGRVARRVGGAHIGRARRAARRRQDDARAARADGRRLAPGPKDPGAGAAPHCRAGRRRAHGAHPVGGRRRADRLARADGLEIRAEDAHRGRHRGRVHAHDPRRSRAFRHRRGAVRRVPRALARCRSGACAGARLPGAACATICASCRCRRRSTARGSRSFSAARPSSPAKAARSRSRRAISAAMPTRASRTRWRTR